MTTETIAPAPYVAAPPIHRARLANGLRVVVSPEAGTGVVAIAVHYAVGYRSEPPGRAGFAHLFEHLMFQGSENVGKLEHFRYVQGSGGSCNATTARDHTCYHQVLPLAALERALFLEADRMRAPRFTAANLATQVVVIREEIGAQVMGRPYGGLPWLLLPPILFSGFGNTHNGYGAVTELSTATVDECETFFDRYYCPANAVLTVVGDVDVDTVRQLVERHFGPIAARQAPDRADMTEPALTATREHTHGDRLAPLPATTIGWRMPDVADLDRSAFVVLAALLVDGESARLRNRLLRGGAITHMTAAAGLTGQPYESLDPDAFVVTAVHRPGGPGSPAILAAIDAELGDLAINGPRTGELAHARLRSAAQRYRRLGRLRERAQALGACEALHGRAEIAWELTAATASCSPETVAAAAGTLADAHRAVLQVVPKRGKAPAAVSGFDVPPGGAP